MRVDFSVQAKAYPRQGREGEIQRVLAVASLIAGTSTMG
jgi:hypothetical protein